MATRQNFAAWAFFTSLTWLLAVSGIAGAQPERQERLSGPYQHKNLSIFLVHGKDEFDTRNLLTLDEAMEKKLVIVHETGNVNQLSIENTSTDKTIFVQAGDIVKGGRQDRVLSVDLFLQPRSGKVSIDAFCVESGRWQKRGSEDSMAFASSKYMLSSKELKLAARQKREQGKVWEEVSKLQDKLAKNTGSAVQDRKSATSLQLSLENDAVQTSVNPYTRTMASLTTEHADAIGFVAVINGEINSAEIYASHDLFKRLWPKLLGSIATEAVASHEEDETHTSPQKELVSKYLVDAKNPGAKSTILPGGGQMLESEDTLYYEAGSKEYKNAHRSYLSK